MHSQIPFWSKLTKEEKELLEHTIKSQTVKKGMMVHRGSDDCLGLIIIISGQLRAFIMSEDGKEMTLYRLLDRDVCLLSASCVLKGMQFETFVEAEQDTLFWHIPAKIFQGLMEKNVAVSNFTNEVMASSFSEVMWLLDQILYKRMDSRVAAFLLDEMNLTGEEHLTLTHDIIAKNLGTAREVVSRILKYMQSEGIVKLSRGSVSVLNVSSLEELAEDSLR